MSDKPRDKDKRHRPYTRKSFQERMKRTRSGKRKQEEATTSAESPLVGASPPRSLSRSSTSEEILIERETSNTNGEDQPTGRRIINIGNFFEKIKELNEHGSHCDCNFSHMVHIRERQSGLLSVFLFKCKMCGVEKEISTEDEGQSEMTVNSAVVLATISTGRGYSEMVQEQAILNIPPMSYRQYTKHEGLVSKCIYDTMWAAMEEAGKEELRLAIEIGDVDNDGNGLVTVIADGAWSKRSYKVNYDAASGVACIVGAKTGKLLFVATRNKYCAICARAESKNMEAGLHLCTKNWRGTSTAMESDIIVEGFRKSVEMHKLKYVRLVGDGDSSVAKKLEMAKPYGIRQTVRKIECTNHLLRNYCTRLREIAKKKLSSRKKNVSPRLRKMLSSKIERLRIGVRKAIDYRRTQSDIDETTRSDLLAQELHNCPMHVFGDHAKCASYFCQGPKQNESNQIPEMKECGLLDDILSCGNRLVHNTHSLMMNMNNNYAETYNSVVAKFVGGKRVNFSIKKGYDTRCRAAALSYNVQENYHSSIHKKMTTKSPGKYAKKHISKLRKMREYRQSRKQLFLQRKKTKRTCPADEDYGGDVEVEDVDFTEKKNMLLASLQKEPEEILELERKTRGQGQNPHWKEEKCCRLTASNFGTICKKRASTNPSGIVKRLLNQQAINSAALRWGIEHESIAKTQFEAEYNVQVRDCGLYVSEEHGFLGASPDGAIDDASIVEIKCPYSAAQLTPQEAVEKKKIKYLNCHDGTYSLKRNHNYFYQIQGQLAIGRFKFCYFVVWTPLGMLVEKIEADTSFWENMVPKLSDFYLYFMLPEILKKY